MFTSRTPILVLGGLVASACSSSEGRVDGPKGQLTIVSQPLTLAGVGDACYGLRVKNGAGQTVWQRDGLCADGFGDEQSGIAYIGSCDASTGNEEHTVELTLEGLYDEDGVALTDFVNPAPPGRPITKVATCRPNADTPVSFRLVVARSAGQGFIDATVQLEDIFCSAKLDCQDDEGAPLVLVHGPSGDRLPSAVLALSCTAGVGADTHVYWSDIVVTCGDDVVSIPVDGPEGLMWSASNPAPAPIAQGLIFRGAEQLMQDGEPAGKVYFSVALGVDFASLDGLDGPCTIAATATASDGPLDQCTTPADAVYPVLRVNAPFIAPSGDAFACSRHGLDATPGAGVWTDYTTAGPESFLTEGQADAGAFVAASCRPPAIVMTSDDTTLGETGVDTASVTLRLSRAPLGPVTIPLAAARVGGLTSVVLGPTSWQTGVTVVLTGTDDHLSGADLPITLTAGPATSTDPRFVGLGATLGLLLIQDGPYCGDGIRNGAEICDGTDVASTCAAQGFDGGALGCTAACTLDTSACTACGNAVVEAGEDCDGDTAPCDTLPGDFDAGTATCSSACTFDTTTCSSCGDGTIGGNEDCDGADLGGLDCTTLGAGHVAGDLACASDCTFDESGCVSAICGNDNVEPGEQCDPPNTPTCGYGQTCNGCSAQCQTTTVLGPRCGDGIQNGPEACDGLDKPTCAELDANNPYGTVTCTGGCTVTASCSTDPCAGQPTTHTGDVTMIGDAAPAGVANPECITTITGTLTIEGPFGANPTIRFPRLTSVYLATTALSKLTINAWPDGVALLPALAHVESVNVTVGGVTIPLPQLRKAAPGTGNEDIFFFDVSAGTGLTLEMPALERVYFRVTSPAADTTIHLGSFVPKLSFLSHTATDTLVTTTSSIALDVVSVNSGSLTIDAPNITTMTATNIQGGTVHGLTNVTTMSGVVQLLGTMTLPSLTTISNPSNQAFWDASKTALPNLQTVTGSISILGTGAATLPASFTTVGGTFRIGSQPLTSLSVPGLVSVGAFHCEIMNLSTWSFPALDVVTGTFTAKNNANLPRTLIDALLAQLTTGPSSTTICGNAGDAACP